MTTIYKYSISNKCYSAIGLTSDGKFGHVCHLHDNKWKLVSDMKGNPLPENSVLMPLKENADEQYQEQIKRAYCNFDVEDLEYIPMTKYWYADRLSTIQSCNMNPVTAEIRHGYTTYHQNTSEGRNNLIAEFTGRVQQAKRNLQRCQEQLEAAKILLDNES